MHTLFYTQFISRKGYKALISYECEKQREKTLVRERFIFHYTSFCDFLILCYMFVWLILITFSFL